MKTTQLRDMDDDGLVEHISTTRRDLFGLRMQHATQQLQNTSQLRRTRRDIARVRTVLNQKVAAK